MKMANNRFVLGCLLLLGVLSRGLAQTETGGYYFGLKGGLTISDQQWSNFDRDPLLAPHVAGYIETLPEEGKFSLYAQLGYHVKGSSLLPRTFFNPNFNQFFRSTSQSFKFYNLSLVLAAKQRVSQRGRYGLYYLFGPRLDYTLDTNLDIYTKFNEQNPQYAIYPFDDKQFIRDINYGFTAGGGLEFPFSEMIGMMLEFTVNPDFSIQYQQPPIPNVLDTFTNQTITIPERRIRNLTFEVTVGFRFLRKIEYID